jgi:hypothetical protein
MHKDRSINRDVGRGMKWRWRRTRTRDKQHVKLCHERKCEEKAHASPRFEVEGILSKVWFSHQYVSSINIPEIFI